MREFIVFCAAAGFSNCVNAGYHYLSASGTPAIISMSSLYSGIPGFQALFQYWLRDNVSKAIQDLSSTPAGSSGLQSWDTAGTTQNWTTFDASSNVNDWHYTLGHFSVRMVGNVWIGPVNSSGDRPVQIQYRSFMWDVYNFTPGQAFGNFYYLAKYGMAAEFLETGESSTEVINTTLNSLNPNALVAVGT